MGQSLDLVTVTFSEDGLLAKKIPNYKVREQQVALSQKIQDCIELEKPLIAEAPTGVGKSLAALVPAFEYIQKTDEAVVVATSSIILQEQYINKDIPMLEELYDFKVKPVLIKGRNNYLCPKKLKEIKNGGIGFTNSEQVHEFQDVLKWAQITRAGDKAELDFVPTHAVWSKFACIDNNDCNGKQCSFYSVCPYYRERNKMTTSKLVVTNYHYLFSAITSEGGNMLPPKTKLLIMDEGHEVNSIARDFQEQKYSMNSLKHQFDQFAKNMKAAEFSAVGESVFGLMTDMELDQVNGTLTDMFVGLAHEFKRVVTKHYQRDFWMIEVPERTRLQKYVTAHIETLNFAVSIAERYLNKFGFSIDDIPGIADMYGEDSAEWFVSVFRLKAFLEERSSLLHYIFSYDATMPIGDDIFWLEPLYDMVAVHVKPTTGAGITRQLFRKDGFVPIVMSATLSANQSFDHLKSDFGIENAAQYPTEEIIVTSPFQLEENLLWYLPHEVPAGNEPGHFEFVLQEMKKIIDILEGRTLCLFTSRKNLLLAETYFKRILPKHIHVLSQERIPKHKVIEFMKANDHTLVLGTKSFFTGIDIQGHHLSAVLIDKFPFAMISDPVNDYLASQPRGFHKYSLPEAIISIKQGFGRLNRTTADKGIVAVYDGRLTTANYKNKIFNSFDYKINATRNWDDVLSYVKETLHF
jgi:ATP-dependent DNA helicase DinG